MALDVKGDLYRQSKDRASLAKLITSPYNRYFARNMVNRMWAELIGRGFYEPIDDFQDIVVHPETLNHLCDEFVASGYDLKVLMKMIVSSNVYSLNHLEPKLPLLERQAAEKNFTAAPTRRMVSEALYDSGVIAGHLSSYKWPHQFHVNLVEAAGNVALRQHKIHQLPAFRAQFVEPILGHIDSFHHLVFPLLHAAV